MMIDPDDKRNKRIMDESKLILVYTFSMFFYLLSAKLTHYLFNILIFLVTLNEGICDYERFWVIKLLVVNTPISMLDSY